LESTSGFHGDDEFTIDGVQIDAGEPIQGDAVLSPRHSVVGYIDGEVFAIGILNFNFDYSRGSQGEIELLVTADIDWVYEYV